MATTTWEYRDGGEAYVREAIAASADRSAFSPELRARIRDWPSLIHLSPARAGALLPLDIPEGARVLEVGAGCGAITRHLGERGLRVTAVEPTPERAAIIRERCAGLDGVEVVCGRLDDAPAGPFDLVCVVGVLEYAGAGDRAPGAFARFAAAAAARLRPGGALLVAIENQLGLKYLAGVSEDHYSTPYAGVEGYPADRGIRTFSRRSLTELLTGAGLRRTVVLGAWPDYKLTSLVARESALAADAGWRAVMDRLPPFPSEDRTGHDRLPAFDERLAWPVLLEAGLGAEAPNSFLALAGDDPEAWLRDFAAERYALDRAAAFATRQTFRDDPAGGATVERSLLSGAASATAGALTLSAEPPHPRLDGAPVWTAFARLERQGDLAGAMELLRRWRDAVAERHLAGAPAGELLDVTPANALLAGDGLEWIDRELSWAAPVDLDTLLLRGLAMAAWRHWPESVRERVGRLAGELGVDAAEPRWREVARLQARVHGTLEAGAEPASARVDELAEGLLAAAGTVRPPLAGDRMAELEAHAAERDADARRQLEALNAMIRDKDAIIEHQQEVLARQQAAIEAARRRPSLARRAAGRARRVLHARRML